MKKRILGLLFLLICCTNYLAAQVDTEFWFAAPYFNCEHGMYAPYRLVIFSFDEEATITVSMPANPAFTPIVRTIGANSYTEIVLANDKLEGDASITTPFNTITQRGLLITSTGKIECYYQVDGDNSEAYTLKGKNALGTDFLVVGQKTYDNGTNGEWWGSRFSIHIVASEDNTEVTINPSNSILLSDETSSSAPITVVLNKGETYAVASYEYYAMFNLAGSTIKSNKPIAVTINDDSVSPNNWNADAVGEQLIPTDFAGTSFVIISGGNSYDICTVFAMYDNTSVTVSGVGRTPYTFTINKGGYETILMDGSQALSVTSSDPIMVFQTLSAVQGGGELGGTVLPHVKCTGSGVVGYKPFSSEFTSYINLITEKKNISKFTIDGVPVSASNFQAVDADDNYYFAAIPKPYSSTPYIISCADGFFQMGVTEGGTDGSNTYGFFSNYGAAYKSDEYEFFKEGTIYTWLNHYDKKDGYTPLTFTAEGVYRDTLMAEDGCDSVCVLHLTKKMAVPDNIEEVNCSAQLDNNEWTIKASYSSDNIMSPMIIPLVGDVNDDGVPEIVCFAADDGYNFYGVNKVLVLNGITKQIIKTIDIDGVVSTQSAGVYGMIKLPNRHTILVVTTKDKHVLGYDLSLNSNTYVWKNEMPYFNPNVSFADFNNDGYPEVYLGNYIYDVETGALLAYGGDNSGKSFAHENQPVYGGSHQYLHAPFAADIDKDGFLELVAGNEVYKVKITNRSGESGNSVSLYRSITPPSGAPADGHTQVADFNLDGHLDVLVSVKPSYQNANVYVYVWDIYNNSLSEPIVIPNTAYGFGGKSMPLIADINADGELEIIIQSDTYNTAEKVQAYKYNIATNDFTHLWSLWVDEDSYSNTMSAFDFNHDGTNELILTDQTTVKIMNGSGKSHLTGNDTINIYAMSSFSFGECTIMQYPVIVDVDKDGSADIIAIGRYGSGHTYIASLNIFTSAGVPWAPARSVWNQYMYNVFNVNEDLTIPTYHYSNAMSFTDPDDPTIIRRPYNNFLQQSTTIDQYGRYVNRAADVAVTSVSQTQTETEWTLTPSYCNNGERDLMAPYQITVYADSYHGEVIATETINESLPVGACAKPTIKIPSGVIEANPSIEQVVIAVNDKGLGVAQRGHQQAECDTTNNIVFVPLQILTGDTTAYICQGESFTWHGKTYTSEIDVEHTYISTTGIDSIVTLHLKTTPLPSLTVCSDTEIDPGESVLLWATGADFMRWEPENSIEMTADYELYAHPTTTTTYTVTGYNLHANHTGNLVYNGDFELGNTGFVVDLSYCEACEVFGTYMIADNVQAMWSSLPSVKAYGGSGLMMIADGATEPNSIVWQQKVSVEPNTYYVLSAQFMSLHTSNMYGQYALFQFDVNGEQVGPIFHSPTTLYEWEQFYNTWYSGSSTTATITIYNQNSSGEGNDFALDEIRFEPLDEGCEVSKTVTVVVKNGYKEVVEPVTICETELPYTWHDMAFTSAQTYRDTIFSLETGLKDSVVILDLKVNPTLYGDTTAYICQGEEFTWHGLAYGAAGDYLHTYTSKVTDCDSVVTLHLTVNPLIYDVVAHDQCADDPYIEFDVTASDGLFHQLQFVFGPKAIAQHFRDTIVAYSSQIQIPNSARAGIYEVAVSPLYNDQVLETRKIQFTLLYPSSVLDQHWDDFIGVLTHNYNGGYDFVGFQWYKDGKPMAGENHSYTYQALEMGAAYSAMLEEADGTRLMTCEIIATPQTEISVYPTLLRPLQIMRLHSTTDVTIWLYDDLGKMTYTNTFAPGDHQLAAPPAPGVYVLRIEQTGTSGKTDTKKLIVR